MFKNQTEIQKSEYKEKQSEIKSLRMMERLKKRGEKERERESKRERMSCFGHPRCLPKPRGGAHGVKRETSN